MASGELHDEGSPAVGDWLNWRPDWPLVRWLALAAAAGSAWVGGVACIRPLFFHLGNRHLIIENPFKILLVSLAALQVWCLFSPRIHAAAARSWPGSLWRGMFLLGTLESGALAVVGIMAIDLRWRSAPLWTVPSPFYTASISFVLFALFLTTTDPRPPLHAMVERCLIQWACWNWRARLMLVFLILQLSFMGFSVCQYWQRASTMFSYHDSVRPSYLTPEKKLLADFDYLCQECLQQIPADANILYHGPNEGLILAYELYPRSVFMLPQEQRDMFQYCWRLEEWCQGMTPDPLELYWKWDYPLQNISEEQFIADHQITYVVTFDKSHVSNTRIQMLR